MLISKYGKRFSCFKCGCLFYDMNREKAICPRCGTDQEEAPDLEVKAPARPRKKQAPAKKPPEEDLSFLERENEEEKVDPDVVSLEEGLSEIEVEED